ncbi:tol-pal system-associated acyl-CoA thioesterase [Aestuariispira ectoiniformans]|uniref:tol-pal system-associated acyl-CoA thioesterase n=1 Tax=Aestuariispira ectoiniformans TaxID=2775080 RepID=UPI00223B6DD3|nr:tol-pal system-associated acyl-CoA thioesterase [Aestuariispira ectoiniformans]
MMLDGSVHNFATRIYYEDTDAGGIVYYANYLKFAERARTEMLRDLGYDHSRMTRDHGLMFAVRRCEADYRRPARLDDLLTIRTRVSDLRGASMAMEQQIMRDDELLVTVKVKLACIDQDGRPGRIPAEILERVQPHLKNC